MAQKAREIMTPMPVALSPDAPLIDAARQMRDHEVGDVLVVEGDRLRGILTDRDLVVRGIAEGRDPHRTRVAEVCSTDELVCADSDDDADQVTRLMRDRAVRRVPVLEDDRPIGIVSLGDLAVERDPRSALADISAAPPNP
jgi:CBS domain-containing protein